MQGFNLRSEKKILRMQAQDQGDQLIWCYRLLKNSEYPDHRIWRLIPKNSRSNLERGGWIILDRSSNGVV